MTAHHPMRDLMQSFKVPPSRLAFVWLVCVLKLRDPACARVLSSVHAARCALRTGTTYVVSSAGCCGCGDLRFVCSFVAAGMNERWGALRALCAQLALLGQSPVVRRLLGVGRKDPVACTFSQHRGLCHGMGSAHPRRVCVAPGCNLSNLSAEVLR